MTNRNRDCSRATTEICSPTFPIMKQAGPDEDVCDSLDEVEIGEEEVTEERPLMTSRPSTTHG